MLFETCFFSAFPLTDLLCLPMKVQLFAKTLGKAPFLDLTGSPHIHMNQVNCVQVKFFPFVSLCKGGKSILRLFSLLFFPLPLLLRAPEIG